MAGLDQFKAQPSDVTKVVTEDTPVIEESSQVESTPSKLTVLRDAFKQYNPVVAAVEGIYSPYEDVEKWDFEEHKADLLDGVSPEYHEEIAGADSLDAAMRIKQEVIEEDTRLKNIRESGVFGAGAVITASILSPDILIGGTTLPRMVTTGARLRKFGTLAAEGAALAAVPSAVVASQRHSEGYDDVFYNALLGAGIGGTLSLGGDILGAISRDSNKVLKSTRDNMDTELSARNASAAETQFPSKFKNTKTTDSITDEADKWAKKNTGPKQNKVAKAIDNIAKSFPQVFKTDSTNLWNSSSSVARKFVYDMAESGSGLYGRSDTAAQLKDITERKYLGKIMMKYEDHVSRFTKDTGVKGSRQTKADSFNRALRNELEERRRAYINNDNYVSEGVHPSVVKAADEWQSMVDNVLDDAKSAKVNGFEAIKRIPGYVPLKWQGNKIIRLSKLEHQAYKQLLVDAYAATGIPEEVAEKIADAVFNRARRKDLQLDSNVRALFSGDASDMVRELIGDEAFEHIAKVLKDKVDDQGKAASARSRVDVDLTVTDVDGRSLLDIVNNDMQFIGSKYAQEMAGRIALGRKGVNGDGAFQRIKEAAIKQASDKGEDVEALSDQLDSIYNQLLSRPATGKGVNRTARRMMDFAGISMLGGMGMAQLAEYGPLLAQVGIRNVIQDVRILNPRMFRREVSDELLDDLETVMGPIGQEEYLYSPYVRLEDKIDAVDNKVLKTLDNTLARAQHINGIVSLQNSIKRHQQRIAVTAGANRFVNIMKNDANASILDEVGMTDKTRKFVKQAMDDGTIEFNGKSLSKLNIDSWPTDVADNFAVSMNRHMHQVVQKTLAGETSVWMDSTLGKIMMQFRNYPVAAMGKQLMRGVRQGPAQTTGLFLYSTLMATLAYNVKNVTQGKDTSERTMAEHIRGVMQMSSPAGLLPNMYESSMAILGQDAGLGGRGVEVANPTISLIEAMAKAPKAGFDLATGEGTRGDVNTMSVITPFSGVVGVANFFNYAREQQD